MIRPGIGWTWKSISGCRYFSELAKAERTQAVDADLLVVAEDELDAKDRERWLTECRNKSNLKPHHRDKLFGIVRSVHVNRYQYSLKYQQKLYGQFGEKSGVDPSKLRSTYCI